MPLALIVRLLTKRLVGGSGRARLVATNTGGWVGVACRNGPDIDVGSGAHNGDLVWYRPGGALAAIPSLLRSDTEVRRRALEALEEC